MMEKSKSGKKTARIFLTNQMSQATLKAINKGKHNVRVFPNQLNNPYHDLAIDETTTRDLRTSSNSSLSLSFFSESDLAEAPSTSGCSSEMASVMQSKERKKEKAKEFMKKLKSMLPVKERMVKMDTLSTLEQVVNNMKRLSEGQKFDGEFKMPHSYTETYRSPDANKLLQSDMFISVSLKNHIVQTASPALMTELGYPTDWWKGRLLRDFLSKKDINTVNGCLAQSSKEDVDSSKASGESSTSATSTVTEMKDGSKFFFARIRRFRKLSEGFSIQNVVSYCPFVMTVTVTSKATEITNTDEDKEGVTKFRKSLVLFCSPLTSSFTDAGKLPTERHFSLRHSSNCKYTNIEPSAISLLGHLPQDLNGKSIFEFYHPEDYPKLLEIYKKIIQSNGQPFKTDCIRLKTRNGCFIELETEWSSFINPWSMRLEFIIGQHTVIKGPRRPDVFEDIQHGQSSEGGEISADLRKAQERILDVLQKPTQDVFTQPAPCPPIKEQASSQKRTLSQADSSDNTVKPSKDKPKQISVQDVREKYTVLDEKGISSIYNQLNYSHNIKKFLLSHSKPFSSNVSDEDSIPAREDNEDDPMHADEEMPLEIPVVKPSSCGSSTQVHVSEQGNGEELLSSPVFGDEAMVVVPPRELPADNIGMLTEDSLKKHTKFQEMLYLQKIAEEQPLLLNMKKRNKNHQNLPQKRPWPCEPDEEVDKAKHLCTISGIFRSSSNIFMKSFPSVSTCNLTPSTYTADQIFSQSNLMIPFNTQGVIGNQPSGLFTTLPVATPPITLMQMRQAVSPMGPVTQPTVAVPKREGSGSLVPLLANLQPQNIQWPFYPQPGYTLLPQVMGGFYRPILQPISVQTPPQVAEEKAKTPQPGTVGLTELDITTIQPKKKKDTQEFEVTHQEVENMISSGDDTGSSIMYLLEGDSFMYEDSDKKDTSCSTIKGANDLTTQRQKHKRCVEPPWLRGVKWNTNVKMRYQMPQSRVKPILKKDEKTIKKSQQADLTLESLDQLLEDISLPNNEDTFDEEIDYLFFPGDKMETEDQHTMKDVFLEVEMTMGNLLEEEEEKQRQGEDKGGGGGELDEGGGAGGSGGGGGGGGKANTRNVIWEVDEGQQQEAEMAGDGSKENSTDAIDTSTSRLTDKEGKDMEPLSDEGTGTLEETNKVPDSDLASIETTAVLIPTSEVEELDKNRISPKGGSLSGDEGSAASSSDGANKQEMEDSQSNCSKLSSDVTPSDERSNEEAGSSHKESNSSVQHLKIHSPGSSLGACSPEEEGMDQSGVIEQWEGMYKKLFVPLKVLVCQKPEKLPQALPFWLAEAHMSPRVNMTYQLPTRILEDVLQEDRKRMSNVTQSMTTKQQLLQLLTETYPRVAPKQSAACQESETASSQANTANPSSDIVQESSHGMDTDSSAISFVPAGKDSSCQDSVEKSPDLISAQKSSSSSSDHPKTELPQKKNKISNTNTDPVVSDSIPDSSASCSSSLSVLMFDKQTPSFLPETSSKKTETLDIDFFFQDCFCALNSEQDSEAEISIEDLIMNKVFVADTGVINRAMKNILSMPE